MRHHTALALCLLSVVSSGCMSLDPNSKWNVNRGEYRDEWSLQWVSRGISDQEPEKEPDGLGKWLYSPKARIHLQEHRNRTMISSR